MPAVAALGRRAWGLSGLVTAAALAACGGQLITQAGNSPAPPPQDAAHRTVTIAQPVTSLTVLSYRAPVRVTAGPVRRQR